MSFDEIIRCLSDEDQKAIRDMMALFVDIDRQTGKFSAQTGLKCKSGCGACCENPDVETTIAEVLPLAVYLWSRNLDPDATGAINRAPTDDGIGAELVSARSICVFYKPARPAASRLKTRAGDPVLKGQGRCGIYAYRPGLCRLFGFASRKDKHGQSELMTCKVIKDSQSQACQHTQEELQKGDRHAPLLTAHAFCVSNIDPVHGQKLLPINQAIRSAVEKIGYSIEK
jgi:Fe-S-cluster containining protein